VSTKKAETKKPVTKKKETIKKVEAKKPVAAKKEIAKKTETKKKAPTKKRIAWKPAAKKPVAKKPPPPKQFVANRKLPASFMKPLQPNAILGAIIGNKALSRTEITKKIWDYIEENGRQDAQNKVMINADDKLKEVFGGKKQVTMFEMTKLVNSHLKKI